MHSKRRLISLVLAASAATVLLAACSTSSQSTSPSTPASASPTKPATTPATKAPPAAIPGSFISQSTYEANKSKYDNSNVVYFFNADWCSTCQEAVGNFDAASGKFPANLTIVDIDYDENSELKQEYGVTVQHTYVEVDPSGKAIKKWTGSVTPEQVESNLAA